MIRMTYPAITTRQSFADVIELFSSIDGATIDMTGSKVQVSIASQQQDNWWGYSNVVRFYDRCVSPTPILTLSTDDGSIPTAAAAAGKYPFHFTPAQIATLCPGMYVVGVNISRNGYAVQLVLGDLPVLDGVVPQ